MKKIVCFLLFVIWAFGTNAVSYIDRDTAHISIMNKAAGKVQTISAPVGQRIVFEKLDLVIRTCKQTEPFAAENYFAFAEISKSDEGKIFSGWMNRNEPGNNPVQNADYDVWLIKCENSDK